MVEHSSQIWPAQSLAPGPFQPRCQPNPVPCPCPPHACLSHPQVEQRATSAILHLRNLNPYLSSTLSAASSASHTPIMSLPRVDAPWASAAAGAAGGWADAGGVSSFAFMGTNAHAIVAAPEGVPSGACGCSGSASRCLLCSLLVMDAQF